MKFFIIAVLCYVVATYFFKPTGNNESLSFNCTQLENSSETAHAQPNVVLELQQKHCNNTQYFPENCGIDGGIMEYYENYTKARLSDHPWTALVKIKMGNITSYLCGGVVITPRYVLTAAHCQNETSIITEVLLGDHYLLNSLKETNIHDCLPKIRPKECNDPQKIEVEKVIVHEDYNYKKYHHDIALLKLKHNVKFGKYLKPICLPLDPRVIDYKFRYLEMAAWGSFVLNLTSVSSGRGVKRKESFPTVSQSYCIQEWKKTRPGDQKIEIIPQQICAGGGKKTTYKGDSGSPLMGQMKGDDKWYLIGIVSFGLSNTSMTVAPSVFTRVEQYVDWIVLKMRENL